MTQATCLLQWGPHSQPGQQTFPWCNFAPHHSVFSRPCAAPCRDPGTRAHLRPCSSAGHEHLLCSTPAETKPAEPKIHSRKERWLQMTNQLKGLSSLLLIPDATFKSWRVTLRLQQHAATCPTSSEASFWHFYNCFAAMCFRLRTFNSFLFLRSEMKRFSSDAVGQWVQNHQCVGDVAAKLSTVTPGFWLTMEGESGQTESWGKEEFLGK